MIDSLKTLARMFDNDTNLIGLVVSKEAILEAGYAPQDGFGNAILELPNNAWVEVDSDNIVVDYGCCFLCNPAIVTPSNGAISLG